MYVNVQLERVNIFYYVFSLIIAMSYKSPKSEKKKMQHMEKWASFQRSRSQVAKYVFVNNSCFIFFVWEFFFFFFKKQA